MKTKSLLSVLFAALFGVAVIGCDETISEKKEVDVKPSGETVTKTEKVTEKDDGSIVHEKSTDVNKPDKDVDVDDNDKDAELKIDVDKD